jgi:hypothetical protein
MFAPGEVQGEANDSGNFGEAYADRMIFIDCDICKTSMKPILIAIASDDVACDDYQA